MNELRAFYRNLYEPPKSFSASLAPEVVPLHDLLPVFDPLGRLIWHPEKKDIPCPAQTPKTRVLLIIGQSNAANEAGQRYQSTVGDRVVNLFQGKCYLAGSPLLGSTGQYGESWTLLGSKLVETGINDAVVIISSAISGSTINRWQRGGELNQMLSTVLEESKSYQITDVIWHQGEADFRERTEKSTYIESFISLLGTLRSVQIAAPIYVAITSKCWLNNAERWRDNNPIRSAQQELPKLANKVVSGVDTDHLLSAMDRYDDCHFSGSGQQKFADAWLDILSSRDKSQE